MKSINISNNNILIFKSVCTRDFSIFIFLLALMIVLPFQTCDRLKTNSAKSEGMMEILNEFLSNINSNSKKVSKPINNNKISNKSKKINDANDQLKKDILKDEEDKNDAYFRLDASDEELGIVTKGWLKVQSTMFKDSDVFPAVNFPDGSLVSKQTDNNNFLINPSLNFKVPNATETTLNTYFYFRLSKINLYFTVNPNELHILNALNIENLKSVKPFDDYGDSGMCFSLVDLEKKNWKLCATNIHEKNKWICSLNKLINVESNRCLNRERKLKVEEIEVIENKPLIVVPYPSRHCNDNWNYQQNGNDWECECIEGKEQSPIDLPPIQSTIESIIKPVFEYVTVGSKISDSSLDKFLEKGQSLKIIYKENMLRILHHNFGRVITFDGAIYQAEEIQFHTPAEHTINGEKFDMEMQVIHYGLTKGDIGKQFILSVLFKAKAGVINNFLCDLDIFSLPNAQTKESDITNDLFIPKVFYSFDEDREEAKDSSNIKHMRPFSFYTYQGSLTSPPCAENTVVVVASEIQKVSLTSLNMFRETQTKSYLRDSNNDILLSDGVEHNNRNVQDTNGRPVFYFDCTKHCPEISKEKKSVPEGHFEKVLNKATEYFFVGGNKPSGIPDSFVVNKQEAEGLSSLPKMPDNF
jgi:carbonic anhydrase